MKDPRELWYKLYDIGINGGFDRFNDRQKILFTYIDFIISLEMGGLSSFLYNTIGEHEKLNNIAIILNFFGPKELASKLKKFHKIFDTTNDGRYETWEEFLNRSGIESEIEEVDSYILDWVTQELVESWIVQNFNELKANF